MIGYTWFIVPPESKPGIRARPFLDPKESRPRRKGWPFVKSELMSQTIFLGPELISDFILLFRTWLSFCQGGPSLVRAHGEALSWWGIRNICASTQFSRVKRFLQFLDARCLLTPPEACCLDLLSCPGSKSQQLMHLLSPYGPARWIIAQSVQYNM